MARRSKSKSRRRQPELTIIHPQAAGIDVGSTFHVVAVPPALTSEPVQTFQSFTGDLYRLADWFVDIGGVTTVAMASTGVYWISVFDILEAHGLEVLLVNARHVKSVPGRKTDVNDVQWLQQLHPYGLLRGSFHPAQDGSALRADLRHRERFVEDAAAHLQHMPKALMHMNLQLHHVVSDITGVTGMKIIRAMVAGQRDPAAVATYRDVRCQASEDTIREALTGHYRREHGLALSQALELYDRYQERIAACDQEIKATLEALPDEDLSMGALPAVRSKKSRQANDPRFEVREALVRVLGADLSQIDGFSPYTALKLVGECGMDMSRWPTAKHFTSWLTLAPGNQISGGKVLNTKTRRSAHRAAKIFRLAALNVGKTHTALGAFYRRLASRVGKAKAVTATARKLAVLLYNALRYGLAYEDPGASYYEKRHRERVLKGLRRRAKEFGYELTEVGAAAGVS